MKRGDIYWARLEPRSGSEQRGTRPVVIISHDGFNETPGWRSITIVPLSTSPSQAQRGPTIVAIPKHVGGIERDSVVLCHQVTTLDKRKLFDYLGTLDATRMGAVEEGIKAALDLW